MTPEKDRKDWLRIWKKLTDPEEKRKQKLLEQRKKRREEKMKDTGL